MSTNANTPAAPFLIPTDPEGLCRLLGDTPPSDRDIDALAERLAAQTGQPKDAWHRNLEIIVSDIENGEEIARRRAELVEALADAETAVLRAAAVRDALAGNGIYDVKHAEGDDLLPHYLDEAVRAIRTAIKVNPTAADRG